MEPFIRKGELMNISNGADEEKLNQETQNVLEKRKQIKCLNSSAHRKCW